MSGGLRARLAAGELLPGGFLVLGAPLAGEVLAAAGLPWALVDLEHGAASDGDLLAHLHAIAAGGAAALVRVESDARIRAGRALDLGADGIMFPRIESAAEAATVVAHLRHPPHGDRGVASSHRDGRFGLEGAEREPPLAVIQIESPGAVAAAAEIATVPGVDVLFVGPRDLRHALTAAGAPPEAFDAALDAVLSAARDAGIAAGIFAPTPGDAPALAARGFRLVALGSDGALLAQAARAAALAALASRTQEEPP